jgi:hypothetical protein
MVRRGKLEAQRNAVTATKHETATKREPATWKSGAFAPRKGGVRNGALAPDDVTNQNA